MNNREEWSQTEQDLEKMLEKIRKEYPDFWAEEPELPRDCKAGMERFREEQAKKRRRRALIAACCAFCILGSTALTLFVNSDTAHAMKFALEKKYYEVTGMISATDPDGVNEENSISVVVTDEAQIEEYKKIWDGLMVPGYMPDEAQFEELYIEKTLSGMTMAEYSYNLPDETKIIIRMNLAAEEENNILWNCSDEVKNGAYRFNLWEDEIIGTRGIEVIVEDILISVCGSVKNNVLIDIVNGLK